MLKRKKKEKEDQEEDGLPVELWCEVFQWLTPNEKLPVRQVCVTWNELLSEDEGMNKVIARGKEKEKRRQFAETKRKEAIRKRKEKEWGDAGTICPPFCHCCKCCADCTPTNAGLCCLAVYCCICCLPCTIWFITHAGEFGDD